MTCQRCDGLMLAEHWDDVHEYTEHAEFHGWKCVNCGAVLDPVIARNRRDGRSSSLQPATPL